MPPARIASLQAKERAMPAKRSSRSSESSKAKTKSKVSRRKTTTRKTARPKVGTDPKAAKRFAAKDDFGIPARGPRVREVSEEAKFQPAASHTIDPRPARSGQDGVRESGVGGNASGPGSSSGGD